MVRNAEPARQACTALEDNVLVDPVAPGYTAAVAACVALGLPAPPPPDHPARLLGSGEQAPQGRTNR